MLSALKYTSQFHSEQYPPSAKSSNVELTTDPQKLSTVASSKQQYTLAMLAAFFAYVAKSD